MKESKRKKLEAAGWTVGSAADFLGLSTEEETLLNMKLSLALQVKQRRQQLKLTQQALAKRLGSSQSRVAKIEVGDPSVSMELLVRSLISLGASPADIGRIIGTKVKRQRRTAPAAKEA